MERLPLLDQSQVAVARRRAAALATRIGFNETDSGRAALVASELAGNILRHAAPAGAGPGTPPGGTGEILLSTVEEGGVEALEMIALDRGRGMSDVGACLEDGFTTTGTAGTGLGAVRRQADLFDIHSASGRGTIVLARLRRDRAAAPPEAVPHGAVVLPLAGEEVCGDNWTLRLDEAGWALLVADGLGHGPRAAEASMAAVQRFREGPPVTDPAPALQRLHEGLRHTRGAAVAVATGDATSGEVVYGGVGNIEGRVINGASVRRMVSHSGTVGHTAPRLQSFRYPLAPGALVVLHSDGISTSWTLDHLPGITRRHPSLVAAAIYREAARGRDDAAVVVLRPGGSLDGNAAW